MGIRWDVDRRLLDSEFANAVDACLGSSPFSWAVYQGFRSFETQNVLYQKYKAGGPLAAPPGHSAHEHGLAVDVAELDGGQELWDYNRPCWGWLFAAVRAAPTLHSGHDFPPVAPADDDHIQSTRWPAVKESLKAQGLWTTS